MSVEEKNALTPSAFARIECHYFVNAGFFPEAHLIAKEQLDKM
jgi:proline iminopeptidase